MNDTFYLVHFADAMYTQVCECYRLLALQLPIKILIVEQNHENMENIDL